MEASKAYAAGKPFLSDSEYDDLRAQLRTKNSKVVQQVKTSSALLMIDGRAQEQSACICIG